MLADLAPELGNISAVVIVINPFILVLGFDPLFEAKHVNGPEVSFAGAHSYKLVLFIVLRIKANLTKLTDFPVPHMIDSIHLC